MSNDKKNILLVGGSGYLGSHLAHTLNSFNVFSTSKSGKEGCIYLNILDTKTYHNIKIKEQYDCIFILASSLQGLGTTKFDEQYINIDTIGLSNFLQYISDNKLTNKIIYTSSMTVYGIDNALPVKEEGALNPLSTYGLGKVLGEKIFNFYCNSTSVNGVVLRIPGIYGGNRTAGYIYNTALKCLKNEPVKINCSSLGYWETINVNDLSAHLKNFIEAYDWKKKVDTFNISYGTKTDFIECAHLIKELLNSKSEISIEGEKGYIDFYLDNSKVKKIIAIDNHYKASLEHYLKTIQS